MEGWSLLVKLKNNIDETIKKSGYKKSWVAEQVGVSNTTLSQWCKDKAIPSTDNLFKLADVLNCSVYDLYEVIKE